MSVEKLRIYCGCGCRAVEIPKAVSIVDYSWNTECYGIGTSVSVFGSGNTELRPLKRYCCRQAILLVYYTPGAPTTRAIEVTSDSRKITTEPSSTRGVKGKPLDVTTADYAESTTGLYSGTVPLVTATKGSIGENPDPIMWNKTVYGTAGLGALVVLLALMLFFVKVIKHKKRKKRNSKNDGSIDAAILEDDNGYETASQIEGEYSTIAETAEVVRENVSGTPKPISHYSFVRKPRAETGSSDKCNNTYENITGVQNYTEEDILRVPALNDVKNSHSDVTKTASYDSLQHTYFVIEKGRYSDKQQENVQSENNSKLDNNYFVLENPMMHSASLASAGHDEMQNNNWRADQKGANPLALEVKQPLSQTSSVQSGVYNKLFENDKIHDGCTNENYDHMKDLINPYSRLHKKSSNFKKNIKHANYTKPFLVNTGKNNT